MALNLQHRKTRTELPLEGYLIPLLPPQLDFALLVAMSARMTILSGIFCHHYQVKANHEHKDGNPIEYQTS